ncbi:MAG: 4-phosphopantetheinyl transferase family protein [Anaerolineales bacterium]|nr:4-phosphopantetheinyl transferase family protein [Anaerolineales bacterium]
MINWLVQTAAAFPGLAQGMPPAGLLGAAEAAHFARLRTEKRRRDWLLGRWTAKHLLQQVLRERCGTEVPLAELQVLNGHTHAPVVQCGAVARADLPSISISHSNSHAFCAALPRRNPPIGADIEQIAPRSPQFVQDYFTAVEQDLVQQAVPEMQATLVTAIWSAKEAALKALQVGLMVDTRCVTCLFAVTAVPPQAWTPFAIELDASRLRVAPPLQGWWRVLNGFVLTLAA